MYISEISKKLKITSRTVRYYEDIGIITSKRLENNYRFYDDKNIDKLKFLVRARKLGFALAECKELIKLFEKAKFKSNDIRFHKDKEVLILRDTNSNDIEYTDTKKTDENNIEHGKLYVSKYNNCITNANYCCNPQHASN